MSGIQQIVAIAVGIGLLTWVVFLVSRGKMQLRYSLLWLLLAIAVAMGAVFPQPLLFLSAACGFEVPSNFLFFVGFVLSIVIMLSLSTIVSSQAEALKNAIQRIAILEKELEEKNR